MPSFPLTLGKTTVMDQNPYKIKEASCKEKKNSREKRERGGWKESGTLFVHENTANGCL